MRSVRGAFLKSVIGAEFCLISTHFVSSPMEMGILAGPPSAVVPPRRDYGVMHPPSPDGLWRGAKKDPDCSGPCDSATLPGLPPDQLLPRDAVFDRRHREEHQNDAKADADDESDGQGCGGVSCDVPGVAGATDGLRHGDVPIVYYPLPAAYGTGGQRLEI